MMDDDANLAGPLSKTRQKQQAKQVEKLAQRLVELAANQLAQLDLPAAVLDDVEAARSTRGRGSSKRQLKYLAGRLRGSAGLVESLALQLDRLDQVRRNDKREFHRLEGLRDRLCNPASFAEAMAEVEILAPDLDHKGIARLARSFHQHADKRAFREIFRRLRQELTESEESPP